MLCFRSCAWGQHRISNEEEKRDEEKADDETVEKEPEPIKDKGEDYDFIVSGAIGAASESPEVKVWRVEKDRIEHIHSLTGHSLGVVSVDVSPNGKCKLINVPKLLPVTNVSLFLDIASSSLDSTLCLWNAEDGKLLNQISLGPVDLWTIAFSPNNKHVISGSNDGKISMYNVETGKSEHVLDPQNGKFTLSLAYSPDGKYIASGALDGIINIFDVEAGKVVQTLEGHAMSVRSLCFSPDSQMLLTASDDRHMKLYDVAHSDVVQTLSGHGSWVLSVSFAGDGKRFASSSSDKTVKIWDVAERKCIHTFNDHQDQVWAVRFSPESDRVVSVSEDKSLILFDCPPNVN